MADAVELKSHLTLVDSDRPTGIAYLLLVHKSPGQVARLVDRLWTPEDTFLVHVDRRSPPLVHRKFLELFRERSNVFFVKRPVPVHLFTFSVIEAILQLFRLLRSVGRPFEYATLLSGDHYPLRPPREIKAFLRGRVGQSFLTYTQLQDTKPLEGLDRVRRWFLFWRGRHFAFPPNRIAWLRRRFVRPLPRGLTPFGGSAWFWVSRDAVDTVDRMLLARPEILRFSHRTLNPDEHFFQTILLNSSLKDTIVNDNLLHENWIPGSAHPEWLSRDDLPAIVQSGKLFARKVDPARNDLADWLDREFRLQGSRNESL